MNTKKTAHVDGTCHVCGESCKDGTTVHTDCAEDEAREAMECKCAEILEHDKSRHFKECPKRGEFPEPAVARANEAEKLVEHLRADVARIAKQLDESENALTINSARVRELEAMLLEARTALTSIASLGGGSLLLTDATFDPKQDEPYSAFVARRALNTIAALTPGEPGKGGG